MPGGEGFPALPRCTSAARTGQVGGAGAGRVHNRRLPKLHPFGTMEDAADGVLRAIFVIHASGSPVAMSTHLFDLPQLTRCRHLAMSHGGQAAAAPATSCPVAAQVA